MRRRRRLPSPVLAAWVARRVALVTCANSARNGPPIDEALTEEYEDVHILIVLSTATSRHDAGKTRTRPRRFL
jgi:hypothetical protein